jgi:hypothetical protein
MAEEAILEVISRENSRIVGLLITPAALSPSAVS